VIVLRGYRTADFDRLVACWHETNLRSFPYVEEQQRHTLDDARSFFESSVVGRCDVWLAEDAAGMLGFIALRGVWISHLSVFPEHQRRGVGTALLRKARECSPRTLSAYTFQRNVAARRFYEHHGFVAVNYGVSPAPESEPDVEYRWVA
jgi:GNAT superfamily N-acetyltransferase